MLLRLSKGGIYWRPVTPGGLDARIRSDNSAFLAYHASRGVSGDPPTFTAFLLECCNLRGNALHELHYDSVPMAKYIRNYAQLTVYCTKAPTERDAARTSRFTQIIKHTARSFNEATDMFLSRDGFFQLCPKYKDHCDTNTLRTLGRSANLTSVEMPLPVCNHSLMPLYTAVHIVRMPEVLSSADIRILMRPCNAVRTVRMLVLLPYPFLWPVLSRIPCPLWVCPYIESTGVGFLLQATGLA